jgi:hypothetical protein
MTVRSFDHTVILVHDLDDAARQYRRLGFRPAPKMHHDGLSTSNHLIMMNGNFLELLGVREEDDTTRELLSVLERREIAVSPCLPTDDAEGDVQRLRDRGVEASLLPSHSREVPLPNGTLAKASYQAVAAPLPGYPLLSLFLTQQHHPEYIWVPEWMAHPNTARRVRSLSFVADDPAGLRAYYENVVGDGSTRLVDGHLRVDLARGTTFEVVPPRDLAERFPGLAVAQDEEYKNHAVGATVEVASLSAVRSLLEVNEVAHAPDERAIRIGPDHAHGIALEFVQADGETGGAAP